MQKTMEIKVNNLKEKLKLLGKVAIAFSGGIDSSFLLTIANKVLLKENVLAIIAKGDMVPKKDYEEAIEFLKNNNYNYIEISIDVWKVLEFRENRKDRCYYCKKNLMSKIKDVAKENGYNYLLDGKNTDDLKVYRPGNKATEELEVISLLVETNFNKQDIRTASKELGIKFWNKPSNSCLATRFPYDTYLKQEDLEKVDKSEEIVKSLGVPNVRVRAHGRIAKIEVEKKEFKKIINSNIISQIKNIGFEFVTLDLEGIKSGRFD